MFNMYIIYDTDNTKPHLDYLNLILLSTREKQNNTILHKFGFV